MIFPWRLALAGAAVVAFLTLAALWRYEHDQAVQARSERDAAELTATVAKGQTVIVERHETQTRIITQAAEAEADTLQDLPDAETPLGDTRRDALCAMLGRMRNDPAACDPPGAGQPESAVPASASGIAGNAG